MKTDRTDRYGRQINNNEAYDLHKFYELNDDNHDNDTNGDKTQNEGYEAEHEQDDDDDDQDNEQEEKPKLSKKMKKQIAKFKAEDNNEIDEDDEFWNQWDENKKKVGDKKLTEKEEKLLNRRAGKMFAYDAETTSSSDESEYDYNKLNSDEVGDDARAILDDNNNNNNNNDIEDVKATKRLAIVNCDWDNITAKDLYMIFRSFLPIEGRIIKVAIHPSDYGIKMMKKEEEFGPDASIWEKNELPKEVKMMQAEANFIDANEENEANEEQEEEEQIDDDDGEDENENEKVNNDEESDLDETRQKLHEEMAELEKLEATIQAIKHGRAGDVLENEVDTIYNRQALRKYELQKLRYYYGIAEFDCIETADRLYQECNGKEYRHTCNILHLSFVSDDFVIPHNAIDICQEIPDNYNAASDKQTNALGSTYLELSWDKTDPNRIQQCQKAFTQQQLNEMDLNAYLQDDGTITDAGFDTDYPVTEYDTDTPDKKVLIKRRARNRYKDILDEFKQMEKNVRDSDDDDEDNYSDATDKTDDEYTFNVFGTNQKNQEDQDEDQDEEDEAELDKGIKALKERLEYKRTKAMEEAKRANLNVENLSSSSSEGDDDMNGDKEDTFNIDDEETNLQEWIDTQKRLKQTINQIEKDNQTEINPRKRRRNESDDDSDILGSDDDEPLVQDDLPDEALNDPYFQSIHDNTYQNIKHEPKKKKQKLNNNDDEEKEKQERIKQRAMLEMIMAGDDKKYDPENNEYDPEELSKRLSKRVKTNWRLKRQIKRSVKRKLAEMDDFVFNADDDRFKALTQDPEFAMDPTNKQFRNTKNMKKLLAQTRKKRLNAWNKKMWNNKLKRNINKEKASSINESQIIQSLKEKSAKIPKLKDGQKHRRNITDKIKQKGLSSFHS